METLTKAFTAMLELRTRFSMLSVVGRHFELDVDLAPVSKAGDDDATTF